MIEGLAGPDLIAFVEVLLDLLRHAVLEHHHRRLLLLHLVRE